MSDEAALMLRVSAFGFAAGISYWFLSYEWAGTIALVLLGAGPGFAGLALWLGDRRRQRAEPVADVIRRFAGVPRRDPPGPEELGDDNLGVLPTPSIWPLVISLGLAVLLTGLVFGLWLVLLGAGMAIYAIWGWLAAIIREHRARHTGEDLPGPR